MILAVDIGNTTTHVGAFRGRRLARQARVPTGRVTELLRQLRRLGAARAEEAVVCSVVPRLTASVAATLRKAGIASVRIVGRDVRVPLTNCYRRPQQVGQDRLVGAYAAHRLYGGDCIIADFGTAVTIDVVSRQGAYLGGVIVPGLDMAAQALAERTALLPRVRPAPSRELLGRDTVQSIRSGLLYGWAALCDGVVAGLKRRYAPRATVIGTGGSVALIAPYAESLNRVTPYLVLEGLSFLSSEIDSLNTI